MKKINENVQKLHEKLRKNAEECVKNEIIAKNSLDEVLFNNPQLLKKKGKGEYRPELWKWKKWL